MRATNSPSTCGMHHISSRQGLSAFSLKRRRTVSRERLSCWVKRTISPARSSSVQRARPSGGFAHAVATRSASSGPESLRASTETGRLAQRSLQVAFYEATLGAQHGRGAHRAADGHGLVRGAAIRREQDLGALEPSGGVPAAAEHSLELTALGLAQLNPVAYVHGGLLLRGRSEAKVRRVSPLLGSRLHGQAGSVPRLHRRLHACARSPTGRSRHPAPLWGEPAFRAPDGAHARARRADPPPARGGTQ